MSLQVNSFDNTSNNNNEVSSISQNVSSTASDNKLRSVWNTVCLTCANVVAGNNPDLAKRIFPKDAKVVLTHNSAQWRQVEVYNKEGIKISESEKQLASSSKVQFKQDTIAINNAVTRGFCHGAVAHFTEVVTQKDPKEKRPFTEEGLAKAREKFADGMPYEAAVTQALYHAVEPRDTHPQMRLFLKGMIQGIFSQKPENQRAYLNQKEKEWDIAFPKEKRLFAATKRFLTQNRSGLTYLEFMKEEMKISGDSLGEYEECISIISEDLKGNHVHWISDARRSFHRIGKDLRVIEYNVTPDVFMSTIYNLPPGLYYLSIPIFTPVGTLYAYHATLLGVGEYEDSSNPNEKNDALPSFFFDPNIAVGEFPTSECYSVVQNVVEHYTGKPFAPVSKAEEVFSRIANFARLRSNPPLNGEIPSVFSIYRVVSGKWD